MRAAVAAALPGVAASLGLTVLHRQLLAFPGCMCLVLSLGHLLHGGGSDDGGADPRVGGSERGSECGGKDGGGDGGGGGSAGSGDSSLASMSSRLATALGEAVVREAALVSGGSAAWEFGGLERACSCPVQQLLAGSGLMGPPPAAAGRGWPGAAEAAAGWPPPDAAAAANACADCQAAAALVVPPQAQPPGQEAGGQLPGAAAPRSSAAAVAAELAWPPLLHGAAALQLPMAAQQGLAATALALALHPQQPWLDPVAITAGSGCHSGSEGEAGCSVDVHLPAEWVPLIEVSPRQLLPVSCGGAHPTSPRVPSGLRDWVGRACSTRPCLLRACVCAWQQSAPAPARRAPHTPGPTCPPPCPPPALPQAELAAGAGLLVFLAADTGASVVASRWYGQLPPPPPGPGEGVVLSLGWRGGGASAATLARSAAAACGAVHLDVLLTLRPAVQAGQGRGAGPVGGSAGRAQAGAPAGKAGLAARVAPAEQSTPQVAPAASAAQPAPAVLGAAAPPAAGTAAAAPPPPITPGPAIAVLPLLLLPPSAAGAAQELRELHAAMSAAAGSAAAAFQRHFAPLAVDIAAACALPGLLQGSLAHLRDYATHTGCVALLQLLQGEPPASSAPAVAAVPGGGSSGGGGGGGSCAPAAPLAPASTPRRGAPLTRLPEAGGTPPDALAARRVEEWLDQAWPPGDGGVLGVRGAHGEGEGGLLAR
jgi:hypothetical protein